MKKNQSLIDFLRAEGLRPALIDKLLAFQTSFPPAAKDARIPCPAYYYYGKELWEDALTALLCGKNLLLVGPKATGKNVLAENLAAAFGRPCWNISFHINLDASYMIGSDTFKDGAVSFRPGPVFACARQGGFAVLDEINMARNEALAVLHSLLDHRHILDVPGYELIHTHPAARFIATMNYGYTGTRELNEALASRFVILKLPAISERNLLKLLAREFPNLKEQMRAQFAALFFDLQKKCASAEISSKALDLRGLLDALTLMENGLDARRALFMGIANKSFDDYETTLIEDVIAMRIPENFPNEKIFLH